MKLDQQEFLIVNKIKLLVRINLIKLIGIIEYILNIKIFTCSIRMIMLDANGKSLSSTALVGSMKNKVW